jgi:preprotein translocase subunit SecA
MRLFNSNAAQRMMNNPAVPDEMAIESKWVSTAIASAQSQVEGRNAEIRKNVLKYDDVLNRQREAIYDDRRHILAGDDIASRVDAFRDDAIKAIVDQHIVEQSGSWDLQALWTELANLYPIGLTIDEVLEEAGNRAKLSKAWLADEIASDAQVAYQARVSQIGEEAMRELERRVVLSVVDRKWRDHLYEMDYLKEGIGLRAMAQRDPLVEYQREGYTMFQQMMGAIKEEVTGYLFNIEVQVQPVEEPEVELTYSSPSESGEAEVAAPQPPAPAARPQQPNSNGGQQNPPANGQGSSFFKRPNS